MDVTHEPQTLTVEEAARILRIGRTAAYALAREWRVTGGRSGLPVLELGRSLRVPRAALANLLDVAASAHERHRTPPGSLSSTERGRSAGESAQRALWDEGESSAAGRTQAPDGAASRR